MPFVNKRFSLIICLVSSLLTSAQAAKLQLSPQIVVDRVLEHGYEAKDVEYRAQKDLLIREKVAGPFDFAVTSNFGYRYDEGEDISGLGNPLEKSYTMNIGLSKRNRFGTLISFNYDHLEMSRVLNPILFTNNNIETALGSRVTADALTLTLRQSLLSNSFGYGSRLSLANGDILASTAELNRQENLEALVLDSMVLYWQAYTAQIKLRDAIAGREKYRELVKVVRNKGRFGIEKKGEGAQVQAEVEKAEQAVKLASLEYLGAIDALLRAMKIESTEDIEFLTTAEIPALPILPEKEMEGLRSYRVQSSLSTVMQNEWSATRNAGLPIVDLVLMGRTTGAENNYTRAFAEAVSGKKPEYYVGLEMKTYLDSSTSRAALTESRLLMQMQENQALRSHDALRSGLKLSHEKVKAYYAAARASVEEVDMRQRTVREQEMGYRQGRMPLVELIRSYDSLFKAQGEKAAQIGNYHISLNQLAAIRDELVGEKKNVQ